MTFWSPEPANDHTLLNNDPTTQFPGMVKITTEGPAPHLSDPSTSSVAVGNSNTGPTPQVSEEEFLGEKKPVKVVSPNPLVRPSPPVRISG